MLQKYCPHLISEIAGLGEGVGISYPEALATNIRGGLDTEMDGACTTYAISGRGTQDGNILSGQNADLSPGEIDLAYILHLKPKDKPMKYIRLSFPLALLKFDFIHARPVARGVGPVIRPAPHPPNGLRYLFGPLFSCRPIIL